MFLMVFGQALSNLYDCSFGKRESESPVSLTPVVMLSCPFINAYLVFLDRYEMVGIKPSIIKINNKVTASLSMSVIT